MTEAPEQPQPHVNEPDSPGFRHETGATIRPTKAQGIRASVIICCLAVALAAVGLTQRADNVTHRIIQGPAISTPCEVDDPTLDDPTECQEGFRISWDQIFTPFQHAPVVEARGVRPISQIFVKLYAWGFGPLSSPPDWLYFLKGMISFILFGLASHGCLIALGFHREALLATLGAMVLCPNLLMAWHFVEYDNLGAAATFYAVSQLVRAGPLGAWRWLSVIGALAFAFLLKESTALIQFAFLGALLWMLYRMRQKEAFRRVCKVIVVGILGWGALVTPLLLGDNASSFASQDLGQRLTYMLHNPDQLVFLASIYGPPLLLLLTFQGTWSLLLPVACVLCLFGMPFVSVYSHYEAYYFSPPTLVLVLGAVLLAATLRMALRAPTHPGLHLLGSCVWLTMLGFGAMQILAPDAREDLSARTFYALTPFLHGAVLMGGRSAWERARETLNPFLRRVVQFGVVVSVIGFGWSVLSSSLNFILTWHPSQSLAYAAKSELSRLPLANTTVMFNHFQQFLGPEELRALGAKDIDVKTVFVPVPDWLRDPQLPTVLWPWPQQIDLHARMEAGDPTLLYWFGARSEMDERANRALVGDFSWSRSHRGGFFQSPPYIDHNHTEDMRFTTYRKGPTPLERLANDHGELLWEGSDEFFTVFPFVTEIPRRLISGVPLVQTYRSESRLYRIGLEPKVP